MIIINHGKGEMKENGKNENDRNLITIQYTVYMGMNGNIHCRMKERIWSEIKKTIKREEESGKHQIKLYR